MLFSSNNNEWNQGLSDTQLYKGGELVSVWWSWFVMVQCKHSRWAVPTLPHKQKEEVHSLPATAWRAAAHKWHYCRDLGWSENLKCLPSVHVCSNSLGCMWMRSRKKSECDNSGWSEIRCCSQEMWGRREKNVCLCHWSCETGND